MFFISEVVAIVVRVSSGQVLELTQSVSGDICDFIERRNVYVLAGEVGDYSECCNWTVEDRAVEFGDNECTTLVLQYDDEQTEISHMHFAIEKLLDGGISYQDEVTEFEVVFDDGGSMLLFKMDHGFDLCSINIGGKHCQVGPTFLQGNSAPSNKVSGGKGGVRWRKKIGCFGNVEWKKWMCAGHCEVRGTAHTLVDCDSVSPHNGGDDRMPP